VEAYGGLKSRASCALRHEFMGVWENWRAFTDSVALDIMRRTNVPQEIVDFFDWAAYAEHLEDAYFAVELDSGDLAIFSEV